VQADFDFHSNFTRDEVLKYFAVPAGNVIKKRGRRNEEDIKISRPQHRPSKVQMKEQERVATKGS
jgi:hypothetical protein